MVRRDKLAAHSRLLRKHTYNVILGLILKRSYEEFKKEFLLNSTSGVLRTNLAFMKVLSSGVCSELQKNFRTRNSSRKCNSSAR